MKKIKIVFLLLILVLITGCSGTYNLNINEDYTVKEELNIVLDEEANNYDNINKMLSEELDNKEDYNLVIEGNNLRLTYSHDYISIEDYLLDSIVYKQLFNNIVYNSDKNEISLETGNIFNLSTSELNNSYNIKILQINVNTPFKVTDENADITSENTYSWTIDKDTKEKELYITFDKESATLNRGTIILIITIVLVIIILIIFAVKRLLQSRKI